MLTFCYPAELICRVNEYHGVVIRPLLPNKEVSGSNFSPEETGYSDRDLQRSL